MLEVPSPDIWHLTVCFFFLNFCAATQDIAVDGWALTMLSEKNVGLASTCNSVGQVIVITTLFTGTGTKLIWPRDSKEILSPAVVCLLVFKKFTAGKGFELFFLLLNIMQVIPFLFWFACQESSLNWLFQVADALYIRLIDQYFLCSNFLYIFHLIAKYYHSSKTLK